MSGAPTLPKAPPGWGDDPLSAHLDNARLNQFATFHNKGAAMKDLVAIDQLLRQLLDGAINPSPFIPSQFLLRAHSAFRSAVGMAMAGQVVEAQAIMRLALESAGYAFFVGNDQARYERWMARHDSPAHKGAVIKEFTNSAVVAALRAEAPKIANGYVALYEQTIDFGAHPNERGFSSSTRMDRREDETYIGAIFLHEDGPALALAIKTVARVGVTIALIARLIYPARFNLLDAAGVLDNLVSRH